MTTKDRSTRRLLNRLAKVEVLVIDEMGSFPPRVEMFVKRRLDWATPLGLPEFTDMPS